MSRVNFEEATTLTESIEKLTAVADMLGLVRKEEIRDETLGWLSILMREELRRMERTLELMEWNDRLTG